MYLPCLCHSFAGPGRMCTKIVSLPAFPDNAWATGILGDAGTGNCLNTGIHAFPYRINPWSRHGC